MDLQYVLVVAVATALLVNAEDMSNFRGGPNSKKIYCGQQLSKTLSAVCNGYYNTLNKKAEIYNGWEKRSLEYPFRSKASATSLMTNFRRRRRRGVFNECCQKPCSKEELSSYCGSRR